jgi:hypothetical protein
MIVALRLTPHGRSRLPVISDRAPRVEIVIRRTQTSDVATLNEVTNAG